jgi:phosphoribosylanthranilate isomerase
VVKSFGMEDNFDFHIPELYAGSCDFFLFDTHTPQYGGSGMQFSWGLLQHYSLNIPFFLSGGIGLSDTEKILSFRHPQLHAIDVNSRLEISPGVKDVEKVLQFIQELKSQS